MTCLDIITLAMKQCRILSSGAVPTAKESEDGMVALQSLYDQWRVGGMFGHLRDYYLTADATAQEGRRYYLPAGVTLTDATNDYVPVCGDAYTECDYASGIGPVRQPRDLALYEVVKSDATHTAKLYDRTGWVDIMGLSLTDTAPLSGRNANGLAACLATSGGFADMFNGQAGPGTITLAKNFLRSIMSKIGSTQNIVPGEYY